MATAIYILLTRLPSKFVLPVLVRNMALNMRACMQLTFIEPFERECL